MAEFIAAKSGETEQQWRQFMAYLFAQVSTGKASTGVLSGLGVSQTTTASGSVLVGSGSGVVQAATNDGASPLVNPSQKTLDIFTANPISSLPRNDIVVFDSTSGTITALIGTPAATPTDPTVPTTALKLARLRHPGSGTSTTITSGIIDDLRVYTSLAPAAVDSGWVNISIAGGKASQGGTPPQVRREGKKVYARWGWANTGITAGVEIVVGTVPATDASGNNLRPSRSIYINAVGSTGNQRGMFVISSGGTVSLRPASDLADYYLFPGELDGWWVD